MDESRSLWRRAADRQAGREAALGDVKQLDYSELRTYGELEALAN